MKQISTTQIATVKTALRSIDTTVRTADAVLLLDSLPDVGVPPAVDQLSNLPIRAMHNGSTIGAFESWEKAITFIQSLSGVDMTELSLTFTTERI